MKGTWNLQTVDNLTDALENLVYGTQAFYMMMDAFLVVPVDERGSLAVIDGEALLDGLLVVVGAAANLSAVYQTCYQLFLRYREFYHRCYLVSTLVEHLLQGFSLLDGTWETIEDDTLVVFSIAVIDRSQDVDHQVIGDELTVVDIFLGCFAQFRSFFYLVAEHITGGDMP